MYSAKILVGDAVNRLRELPEKSVRTVVTSPPYWGLRDYGHEGQLGLEATPQEFVENLCQVFDEVWRVLADDGTVWVNLGDTYANNGGLVQPQRDNSGGLSKTTLKSRGTQGHSGATGGFERAKSIGNGIKAKDLVGIPWRFAFAMQDRGWYLRQDIIWAKPNPMPESVTDRCTKAHEYVFLMSKQPRYYFDHEAIREPVADPNLIGKSAKISYHDDSAMRNDGDRVVVRGDKRNKRSVWTVTTKPYKGAHFATYPSALIEPCILAGSAKNDTVLDPFSGSGTTGEVALQNSRDYIGIELNPEYAALSERRIANALGMFAELEVEA